MLRPISFQYVSLTYAVARMYILSCKWRRASRPVFMHNNAAGSSSGRFLTYRWMGSTRRFECTGPFETADPTTQIRIPEDLNLQYLGWGGCS